MITELFTNTPPLVLPLPLHICSIGRFNNAGPVGTFTSGSASFGATTWDTNNLAVYIPIHIPSRFTIARFMVPSGNNSGNVDVGIYNASGALLLSTGTVAKNSTSNMYFGVTDRSFPAGHYYLALVCSTTAGSVFQLPAPNQYVVRMCGWLQEALGSTVLPATMTPVSYTSAKMWMFGFTQSDTL